MSDDTECAGVPFTAADLKILASLHESVSTLCCAASYVVASDDTWGSFKEWLHVMIRQAPAGQDCLADLLGLKTTRERMVDALWRTDQLLMVAEGIQALNSEEFSPPWMDG